MGGQRPIHATFRRITSGVNMTSKEMLKATHPPGFWFVNVAPLGSKPNWQIQPTPATSATKKGGRK